MKLSLLFLLKHINIINLYWICSLAIRKKQGENNLPVLLDFNHYYFFDINLTNKESMKIALLIIINTGPGGYWYI